MAGLNKRRRARRQRLKARVQYKESLIRCYDCDGRGMVYCNSLGEVARKGSRTGYERVCLRCRGMGLLDPKTKRAPKKELLPTTDTSSKVNQ